MEHHVAYAEKLVAQGGPRPEKYAAFDRWLDLLEEDFRNGRMSKEDLEMLHDAFGRALSTQTLQGFSLQKPHGYTGDYEIIDRMYEEHVSPDPMLRNWDLYFQAQSAPKAVRNRKAYLQRLLHGLVDSSPAPRLPVLNVASGPGRDMLEYFSANGSDRRLTIECVDSDRKAIDYARALCRPFLDRIDFRYANALRFSTRRRYKLIWSAGLFDYFGDKAFKFLLERILSLLDDDGELVIGNFSEDNGTRAYMEMIGDWYLCYRNEAELVRLATSCGVAREDIRIGREPEGVNLFLHIKRGARFLPM